MPASRANFEELGSRLYSALGLCLNAALIAATIFVIVLSFRFGVDRGQDTSIPIRGVGHFLDAVCSILSQERYGAGRYVCTGGAQRDMEAAGLGSDQVTLDRVGKSLSEWLYDTAFLNRALKSVFLLPPMPDRRAHRAHVGDLRAIGWGGEAGYADFVDFAFRLLGHKVESLYIAFFLLFAGSTVLMCIQFHDKSFALFSIFSFHSAFFSFLPHLDGYQLVTLNNPRMLSLLAIVPALHALFLIAYGIRPSRAAVLLFIPQALLMAAAAHFRALGAYSVLIALFLCSVVSIGVVMWRRRGDRLEVLRRYWAILVVFLSLVAVLLFSGIAEDERLAATGGMRLHTFWEPLYYNLQYHPRWHEKYSAQHGGATGDAVAERAVASYRERHQLLANPEDYFMGDRSLGLTLSAYEKYTRAAFLEFVARDPWYFVELKYYNAMTVLHYVGTSLRNAWASIKLGFLLFAACSALALVVQIHRQDEALSLLGWTTAVLIASAVLVVLPVWAMIPHQDLMADGLVLIIFASFN
jgi:hypothetical protein